MSCPWKLQSSSVFVTFFIVTSIPLIIARCNIGLQTSSLNKHHTTTTTIQKIFSAQKVSKISVSNQTISFNNFYIFLYLNVGWCFIFTHFQYSLLQNAKNVQFLFILYYAVLHFLSIQSHCILESKPIVFVLPCQHSYLCVPHFGYIGMNKAYIMLVKKETKKKKN